MYKYKIDKCPSKKDIEKLVAFLPALSAGSNIVEEEATIEHGAISPPIYSSVYGEFLDTFFPFTVSLYHTPRTVELVRAPSLIASADLHDTLCVISYCWRGDRFSDGLFAMMVENGVIQAALERLAVIAKTPGRLRISRTPSDNAD